MLLFQKMSRRKNENTGEVMNLIGDVRYVSDPEYAAFSEDESAEEREYWYQHYRRGQSTETDELAIRSEFDKKAPPGYFGYRRAFRGDGYYGGWLLEKPLMMVVARETVDDRG
jgi:hypothetical protein